MTTAPRAFRRSVERKAKKQPSVDFVLESVEDDGETVKRVDAFTATMPSDEVMFLIAAIMGAEDGTGAEEAAAVMEIFERALPEDQYKILRQRLRDPEDDVDIEMLQEILMWLMEQWSAFPTQPSSDSSVSRSGTGTTSTGRAPGRGSTRSISPSSDS